MVYLSIVLQKVESQEQIDTLCRIADRVWRLTYDALLPQGQVDYMLDKFQSDHAVKEQMAHQNYQYYLMCCEGESAGFVGFAPRYEGREEMFLSKVYLLPEYRGQGAVGKALAFVEEQARKEGLPAIRLTVNKENTHAFEVYRHYGFQVADKVETDIGGGYVMDDFIMVKTL